MSVNVESLYSTLEIVQQQRRNEVFVCISLGHKPWIHQLYNESYLMCLILIVVALIV